MNPSTPDVEDIQVLTDPPKQSHGGDNPLPKQAHGDETPPKQAKAYETPPKQLQGVVETPPEKASEIQSPNGPSIQRIQEYLKSQLGEDSLLAILGDEISDKICWLAVHGVPTRSITFEIYRVFDNSRGHVKREDVLSRVNDMIRKGTPELLRMENPIDDDAFVKMLIGKAQAAGWGPQTLVRALEHGTHDHDGPISPDRLGVLQRGRERLHYSTSAVSPSPARFRTRGLSKVTLEGSIRRVEVIDQALIKGTCVEQGGQEEEAVMKQWLTQIRQAGEIAQLLDDNDSLRNLSDEEG